MRRIALYLLFPAWLASADSGLDPYTAAVLAPCMGIKHSVEVMSCLMDLADSKKKEYESQFKVYLQAIASLKEDQRDQQRMTEREKKAKEGWDIYTENSCMAAVTLYEKERFAYKAKYYNCIIINYSKRIDFYKKEEF
ncbi:hypothetical protein LU631_04165 [Erwinia tracheiphila]|uniref:DUF1311 domain-containing protein n=1 Tax=Erwinia tracheiphila TaxID=65700 RepID=A0A0M2KIR1_9GAMM|nr:hypothetical protein [Erwinia tracheiphila]AXF78067.1 hypothetical protein AV903_21950 [Erwinia tracheiphila]EOS95447.1 hypothetical protein ETR_08126 [Erwinia tracheiphila PSU-1]KKF37202.1 hypothetical protein SY86_20190 [Erwinia tracheiphila]UIA83220.1 hypothetical protein LU604_23200 [Erwinia tracheiphila]UIA88592.1 hypothetical protein LU631_04165 [Erwinia tracheiphila]